MRKIFVTGTDTGVGKTYASCALLQAMKEQGKATLALKPVAAGGEWQNDQWVNEDAVALQKAATIQLPYAQVNPAAFKAATSPHIAAHLEQKNVTVSRLEGICKGAMMQKADVVLIEGAGGWRVPLNPRETLADLAVKLEAEVVIVVALRLGCINHALLTLEAVKSDGLNVAGWVANRVQKTPMDYEAEYLSTLKVAMGVPLLANLSYDEGSQERNEEHSDGNIRLKGIDLCALNL